ncbi:hypothetical protein LLG96_15260 [bacterium]|nr:hypothetical protein [bacterium]
MFSHNKQEEQIVSAINDLSRGDERPLRGIGVPDDGIAVLRRILNIYSLHPPLFIREIIVSSFGTHNLGHALLRLDRFIETAGKDTPFVSDNRAIPRMLASLFASSGSLSGRLGSDVSLLDDLAALENPESSHTDKNYYLDYIGKSYAEGDLLQDKLKKIHRHHTIQLLRICVRNADPVISITEISAELSALADAVIEACLELAAEELYERLEISGHPHSLVVLGLGKLGGRELNVSSDIDLIYLCPDQNASWGSYDCISFHTMLAERLTRLLNEPTAQGALYRVDTRLRADGASGPLVRSLKDYFRYLELRGEGWERQMLLKARPVAGNYAVADDFLRSLERFIFPSSLTRSPNREIVALKDQIEARIIAEGSKKTHLKLMEGGIRDIEFITQCLQLLMGGIHSEVRSTNTLTALERLREFGAFNEDEHGVLSDAYRFFRQIENALQWRELLPAFTLPVNPDELDDLARFIGFMSEDSHPGILLTDEIEKKRKTVRALYNEIFNAGRSDSFEEMAIHAAVAPPGDEKVRRFLENVGFTNPEESARTIADLAFERKPGVTDVTLHPSTERFLPKFFKALTDLPDPGGALDRFNRVAQSYNARQTLFDILANNDTFLELLISLTHGSVFITDILSDDPSLLDWLFETAEILHPINIKEFRQELNRIDTRCSDNLCFTRLCLTAKNHEKLRISARDITGLSTTFSTYSELTQVGEAIVRAVYARTFRELSAAHPVLKKDYEFAVIAAGRLGAEIMNFGSDLDLIFVYNAGTDEKRLMEIPGLSVKLAQQMLSLITGGGGVNKVYDVDARLRPEGGNSVLAISFDEYRKYLDRRASEWERLALVRARAVAGSAGLGRDVIGAIHRFVYRGPFSPEEVSRIYAIRAAMTESSLKRYPGLTNIKSGPGGIADIDFIAQSYAAHHGLDRPAVQLRETTAILKAFGSERILDRHSVSALTELYEFLSTVEKVLRISSGKAVNTVPAADAELTRVARLLGFKNVRRFTKRLDDVRIITREYYERLMKELRDRAENGSVQS